MITAFSILLVLAAAYYAGMIGYWAAGFRRVRREAEAEPGREEVRLPFVSVVVAARDEEDSVEACLRSILTPRAW